MLAPFVAEGFCELSHRAFGSGVGRHSKPALECKKGAKIDDFAPLEGNHMAPRGLREKPDGFEVHIENLERGVWSVRKIW